MFAELRPDRKRWRRSLLASFGLQCAAVFLLVHRSAPVFVTPSDVDKGIPGSSGSLSIVYLAPVGSEQVKAASEDLRLSSRASLAAPSKPVQRQGKPSQTTPPTQQNTSAQTAHGGTPWGRVPGSAITGNEVVPALPQVFPDPPVSRADLPSSVEGDVIVEVTIDAEGNVTETKLLQGIGYGVEQKVLGTLQHWHFRPAMKDGVTIASQHIVHFHYPA